ncbi:snare associated Golgi protein-domain-containing protein [Podospora australis]|uniref:Golgi apparatus membrane protein TVP38 n=1 Tax=Podospora australis TaxID=1536484 RepID=A0AAN7ADI3_9PEZI|nr:snare associated Golgi protein-domain-containing protein [Podospora australis]
MGGDRHGHGGFDDVDIEMEHQPPLPQRPQRTKRPRRSAPEETDYQPVNWKRVFLRPKYMVLWIIFAIIIVLTVIITIYHDDVVKHLRPFAQKVRDLRAGWLIPIVILIVISFPPLFGHEIIALLCGVVYGLWIGFGVVAAGTFFGEVGTWFAFKYLFRKKSEKLERTNLNYGALARITRDGGFWIVMVIRFSAIPTHFSTAVFSTCDVRFWIFATATFLTLPKQIFLVYLGVLLLKDKPDDSAKDIVFGVAFVLTIAMAVWIGIKMQKVKKVLLEEQTQRRNLGTAASVPSIKNDTYGGPPVQGADYSADPLMASEGSSGRKRRSDGEWLLEEQPERQRDYEALVHEEGEVGVPGTAHAAGKSLTPLQHWQQPQQPQQPGAVGESSMYSSAGGSGWTSETINTPSTTSRTPSGEYMSGKPVQGQRWV